MDRAVILPDAIALCRSAMVVSSSSNGGMSNRRFASGVTGGPCTDCPSAGLPPTTAAPAIAPNRTKSLRSIGHLDGRLAKCRTADCGLSAADCVTNGASHQATNYELGNLLRTRELSCELRIAG